MNPDAAVDPEAGIFVSFEGGDGVGKSTQIDLLASALRAQTAREVIATREPGGTALGTQLRQMVLHGRDMSARAEALIFAADRAQHVAEIIRPALARGAFVVTDRYADSSIAYQAAGRKLSVDDVEALSRWATGGLQPTLTVLLDMSPAVAAARSNGDADRMESTTVEFRERIRAAFLERAASDPQRWLVIDASMSIARVHGEIMAECGRRGWVNS
ncbi:dTMP kinase [Rarobacter incanus]|uniref:Thymidylate kinase n=1 Tax=Rarobacter incanus TaxID=153494 RepID=A0A542SP96_9MICO|nr:dTMP kinase [Rarobacter incanus]TQK76388.1 thymidylate kinase [Rarobacter incanus]